MASWLPLVIGSLLSAGGQMAAGNRAADAAEQGSRRAIRFQRRVYKDTTKRMEPFYEGGTSALEAYMSELGLGEAPEGYEGYMMSPMARYALEKGVGAIESGAAMRGGLYSGATLEALEKTRNDIVSADVGTFLDRLYGMAGMGQQAAANTAAAGANYATGAGNAALYGGAARADAYRGMGDAISGGINDLAGIYGYFNQNNPLRAYSQPVNTAPETSIVPMARPF